MFQNQHFSKEILAWCYHKPLLVRKRPIEKCGIKTSYYYNMIIMHNVHFIFPQHIASYPSLIQQCMRSVALIKVSGVWGSGVIINAKKGLILTCRHVVYKAESLKGKLWLSLEDVDCEFQAYSNPWKLFGFLRDTS